MVKEDVEDLYEFHFSLLFYSRFSFTWHLPRVWWKSELAELFRIPCSCRRSLCCYKRLWELSVTKPVYYKDVFVNSFRSPTFRLANYLVVEPVLWLITKWLSNLELIPSSLRQNNNGDIFKIQCIVFGHLQTLRTS